MYGPLRRSWVYWVQTDPLPEIPIVTDHNTLSCPCPSEQKDIVLALPSLFFHVMNIVPLLTQERDQARRNILIGQEPDRTRSHPTFSRSTYISFCEDRAAYCRHAMMSFGFRWG